MMISLRPIAVDALASLACLGLVTVGALPETPAAANVITGMNAYWNFNETVGATTAANSGTAGATLNGTLLGSTSFVAGLFGNAVRLPGGTGDYVNVGNQVVTNGQEAYTVSTWFNPAAIGAGRQVLFESGANYALSSDLVATTSQIRHYVQTTDEIQYSSTSFTPAQGEWHHLAIAYSYDPDTSQGTSSIFINGIEYAGNQLTSEGKLADTTYFRIGSHRNSTALCFNGLMDDTALWNRALDARTVAAVAGLGHVSGVSLNDDAAIDGVLAMNAVGQSATAGSDTWHYTNGLVAPTHGGSLAVGSNYEGVDGNHYIVLDGSYKEGFTGVATAAPSLIGGLTAYWDFNEASGETVARNSNLASGLAAGRAALDGGLLNDATLVSGKFGNAVALPGDGTAYVKVDSQVIADGQEAYTISTWFNPAEIGTRRQVLFESGINHALSADLDETANRIRQLVKTTEDAEYSSTSVTPAEGEWRHLAITYTFDSNANQGASKVYIDGVEYPDNELTSTGALASTTFFNLGRHRSHSVGHPFNGLMDDTAIWNRPLDSRSIAAIAGLGSLAGLDLNMYDGIDAILALDGQGQSATAGNLTWNFTDTFEYLPDGQSLVAGMHYIGTNGHYYIVLDGNGQNGFTGVWAVPEPGMLGLVLTGLLAAVVLGRRQRRSLG